jgi:hypothetical protein
MPVHHATFVDFLEAHIGLDRIITRSESGLRCGHQHLQPTAGQVPVRVQDARINPSPASSVINPPMHINLEPVPPCFSSFLRCLAMPQSEPAAKAFGEPYPGNIQTLCFDSDGDGSMVDQRAAFCALVDRLAGLFYP